MRTHRLSVGTALFIAFASTAYALDEAPCQKAASAISRLFPDKELSTWACVNGDLNADRIDDLAIVLTGFNPGRGERLVVLSGNSTGDYSVLSMSDEFCNVRWHYDLDVTNRSLFVKGFSQVSDRTSYFTLQFRYNERFRDFELIGSEDVDRDNEAQSIYRVSINYLNGSALHSRTKGTRQKEVKARIDHVRPARLQGFKCEAFYTMSDSSIYIADDFSVKRK